MKAARLSMLLMLGLVMGSQVGAQQNGFPTIEPAAQKARDDERLRILRDELEKEERALFEAKRDLQESADRLPPKMVDKIKTSIPLHQGNIESLKREITAASKQMQGEGVAANNKPSAAKTERAAVKVARPLNTSKPDRKVATSNGPCTNGWRCTPQAISAQPVALVQQPICRNGWDCTAQDIKLER